MEALEKDKGARRLKHEEKCYDELEAGTKRKRILRVPRDFMRVSLMEISESHTVRKGAKCRNAGSRVYEIISPYYVK